MSKKPEPEHDLLEEYDLTGGVRGKYAHRYAQGRHLEPARSSMPLRSDRVSSARTGGIKESAVPVLSRFYGIVVFMNYQDHEPPHFPARFQDHEVLVELDSGLVRGMMSKRALRLVLEWTDLHLAELVANWERARKRETLEPIDPLP